MGNRGSQHNRPAADDHGDRIADLDRRVAAIEAVLETVAVGVEELRNRESQPTNWLAFIVAAGIIGGGGAVYLDTRMAPTERAIEAIGNLANRNAEGQGEIRALQDVLIGERAPRDETIARIRERLAAVEARIPTSRLP